MKFRIFNTVFFATIGVILSYLGYRLALIGRDYSALFFVSAALCLAALFMKRGH